MRWLLLITFSLSGALSASAQLSNNYSTKVKDAAICFERAGRQYYAERYDKAIEQCNLALKYDSTFTEPHMLLGIINRGLGDCDKAIFHFAKGLGLNEKVALPYLIYMAQCEIDLLKYEQARKHLEYLLAQKAGIEPKRKKKAQELLVTAKYGEEALKHPVPFNPLNLGPNVNSQWDEYLPAITADEQQLVITRQLPTGKTTMYGEPEFKEDFFVCERTANNWTVAKNIGPPINTADNEGAQAISPDGQLLYFTGCNRPGGKGECDIYVSEKYGILWHKPKLLPYPVNTSKWDSQPSVSSDGRTLYFTSNRPGGKGSTDIYSCRKGDDGKWSKPVSLNISTEGSDVSPFIHPDDQTLYFASNGYPGMGGLDIYIVRRNTDGSWGKPMNLGYPINTPGDETSLIVSASGTQAFFASDREDAIGKIDLYSFDLYEAARPTAVTFAKGKVYDSKTKKGLGAEFELLDLRTGEVIARSKADETTGQFLVTIPVNRNYALNVTKDGYLFYSENFKVKERKTSGEPYKFDVPLQPIEAGSKVVLKNVFFEVAKYDLRPESKVELQKLIYFLKKNPTVTIELGGHTDSQGDRNDNQVLGENRAKAVKEYLVVNGIAASRLSSKGFADSQPLDTNNTPEGRARNRRTEFKVTGK